MSKFKNIVLFKYSILEGRDCISLTKRSKVVFLKL